MGFTSVWDEHGLPVNRKCVQRLMRMMGIRALYPGARTTRPNQQHKTYPYLLRDLVINRVNQVWCTDITYIPMRKGFLYLVAIMDWYSRKGLSWRLSNSLDTMPCIRDWMDFYNQNRRHASLGRMTPDQVYYDLPSQLPITA